jgi:hypothetical protein
MPASKVNLWKCVEMVQCNTENQRSALSHFRRRVEAEQSNTQATMYRSYGHRNVNGTCKQILLQNTVALSNINHKTTF